MPEPLLFVNVRLMDPASGLDQLGALLVQDGRIADFGTALGRPDGAHTIDGDGAILCPGIEVGEEAFVGAGAVVTKDVPPGKLVVGNPARVLRDVPEDELLQNQ